ncbi:MAG: cytochrome c maturation protein CcmE [Gammaproteobacteria bacterium]
MHPLRKQRLLWLLFLIAGVAVAIGLSLYALRQNINAFYLPSQVVAGEIDETREFRIGGLVVDNSVVYFSEDLSMAFTLTDSSHEVVVHYVGVLPDLFAEGQGIVAQGRLDEQGTFIAREVLAKHDSDYMPKEVRAALEG